MVCMSTERARDAAAEFADVRGCFARQGDSPRAYARHDELHRHPMPPVHGLIRTWEQMAINAAEGMAPTAKRPPSTARRAHRHPRRVPDGRRSRSAAVMRERRRRGPDGLRPASAVTRDGLRQGISFGPLAGAQCSEVTETSVSSAATRRPSWPGRAACWLNENGSSVTPALTGTTS